MVIHNVNILGNAIVHMLFQMDVPVEPQRLAIKLWNIIKMVCILVMCLSQQP